MTTPTDALTLSHFHSFKEIQCETFTLKIQENFFGLREIKIWKKSGLIAWMTYQLAIKYMLVIKIIIIHEFVDWFGKKEIRIMMESAVIIDRPWPSNCLIIIPSQWWARVQTFWLYFILIRNEIIVDERWKQKLHNSLRFHEAPWRLCSGKWGSNRKWFVMNIKWLISRIKEKWKLEWW